MLGVLLALAAPLPVELPPPVTPRIREVPLSRERAGPTPVTDWFLRPGHKGSDDRMFPDIAIGDMRVDGNTLYVKVENKGGVSAQSPVLVAARAQVGGVKTDLAEVRTARLAGGESRWVAIKGFSIKSASTTAPVFELANATAVSAVARLLPSGALDRSGQGCGDCTVDADETNNVMTAAAAAIQHGPPR